MILSSRKRDRFHRRLVGGEFLEDRRLLAFDPSPFEQEQLEHINRMRLNPAGELAIFFDSLSPLDTYEGNGPNDESPIQDALDHFNVSGTVLQQQWAQLTAVPPLAWNENLHDAAELHTELSVEYNLQAHRIWNDANGNGQQDAGEEFVEPDLGDRVNDAGYSGSVAENVYAFAESMIHGHAGFVIDWGDTTTGIQEPPGHRNNIMSSSFREVGVSVIDNSSNIGVDDHTTVGPFIITQEFGTQSGYTQQILGVVWEDGWENGYYEAGEGYAGVDITILGDDGFMETTTTMTAGGFQAEVPSGTYEVRASVAGFGTYAIGYIDVGRDNVKVDFNIATGKANRPPTATPETFDVDGSRVLRVLSNDTDADGTIDPATVMIVTEPAAGSVEVNSTTGEITYTADGSAATDSFEYLVRDDDGASAQATVTLNIEIVAENVAPVASDGDFTVDEDTDAVRSLAGLVTDADGTVDWATLEVVEFPSRGTLTYDSADTSFTYRGQANFSGTDSFQFRVADDAGAFSNTATVELTIVNINDPPVAVNDVVATVSGESRLLKLYTNDTDADNDNLANGVIEVVDAPSEGAVESDGSSLTYTAANDFVGSETFTYRIRDAFDGTSNIATVTVFVSDPGRRWQNPVNPNDVDGDGAVGPLDAIRVINAIPINGLTFPSTIPGLENAPLPFIDVTGDGNVAPLDALQVINALPSTSNAPAAALSARAVTPSPKNDPFSSATEVRQYGVPFQGTSLQEHDLALLHLSEESALASTAMQAAVTRNAVTQNAAVPNMRQFDRVTSFRKQSVSFARRAGTSIPSTPAETNEATPFDRLGAAS